MDNDLKEEHFCHGKIVDEDRGKNRWLIRCDICGRIYEGVSSESTDIKKDR